MTRTHTPALGISRVLLRILQVLNIFVGVLLVGFFVATFLAEPFFRDLFVRDDLAPAEGGGVMTVLRLWLILALPTVGALHILLSRLLEMLGTVKAGDPFVPENARRLKTIAWCALAVQVILLLFGPMAAWMNAAGSQIDGAFRFDLSGWLAVALAFVLAQVFEAGTAMRADLDAMI